MYTANPIASTSIPAPAILDCKGTRMSFLECNICGEAFGMTVDDFLMYDKPEFALPGEVASQP